MSSKPPGTLGSQQFLTVRKERDCHRGHCDANVAFHLVQSGWLHACDQARELLASFRGGRFRARSETTVWETSPETPRAGRAELQGGDPEGRLGGWGRASGRTARGEAPRPAWSSRSPAAESAAGPVHSPWRSLEPWAAALQRRRSRHREDQLHLWAAAAAAKPGNILAGQRPLFGHHLLPPRRRRQQLTP